MMPITEVETWDVGPFRVRKQPRNDNPYWPCYLVFEGDRLIGKSFSIPDLGCCEWLKRQDMDGRTVYADSSAPLYNESQYRRGGRPGTFTIKYGNKRGRPTKAEQARREAALLSLTSETAEEESA